MERVEADQTPGQEWQQSLNATINRLSTQYVNLLRAASSAAALEKTPQDPRVGGGAMQSPNDAPTPPVASSTNLSALHCQLAVENICVATSQLLSLIRTLRLSLLLMDEETTEQEEEWQVHQLQAVSAKAQEEANLLEQEWLQLRTLELENATNGE
eukprot:Nitzschia sp. Nitz4//scaffold298_size22859//9084//9685//NITZ4_008529-RA/size22859-augustus-gene-0.1-mRNA-1//1//CDS//3329546323//1728//frame0